VDTDEFDLFADGLDHPMLVVTVARDGERSGCLVGFATQCSIDPPRMLVCVSKANHTYRLARDADLVAVHVLGQDQHDLAELFGGETDDEVDKFTRCDWSDGPGGTALLATPRRLVGRVLARHDLGDHVGLLLDPVSAERFDDRPPLTLTMVDDIDPGHPV
jgi:flavin reductase (DIM6/NTAB) family NADH-FMN oxidoreductase RutF